jgi:large subunit ribosomal protein L17
MRKCKKGRKLSRKRDQRKALLKSLATALFLKEKIKTTEAKAKEISSLVEKFITKAKKGDLVSRRYLAEFFSPQIVKKLVGEIAQQYKERSGGYTRIIKLGQRKSDGARMAIVELVK